MKLLLEAPNADGRLNTKKKRKTGVHKRPFFERYSAKLLYFTFTAWVEILILLLKRLLVCSSFVTSFRKMYKMYCNLKINHFVAARAPRLFHALQFPAHTDLESNLPLQSVSPPLRPAPVSRLSSNHHSDNSRDPPTNCQPRTAACARSHIRLTIAVSHRQTHTGSCTRLPPAPPTAFSDIHHRGDGNRDNGHKLASWQYAKRGSNN